MPRSLTADEIQRHKLASIRCATDAEFSWLEPNVEAAEGETKLKKFSITAYTGGPMRVGFGYPVVVDLAGMTVASGSTPILKDHDATQIVGHTDSVDKSVKRLKMTGVVSGVGDAAQEVTALGANGFPWQASIGASIEQMEFVNKGESVNVNGRSISGPVYIARKSALRETSFVAIGADAGTSGRIAAHNHQERTGVMDAELKAYIEGMSFDPAALSETQLAGLKASFEASKKKPDETPKGSPDAQLAKIMAEASRRDEINKIFLEAANKATQENRSPQDIDELAKLRDGAIEANWDVNKFQLAMLQASRGSVAIHVRGSEKKLDEKVLEAAICMAGKLSDIEKKFSDQTLQAAHDRFRNGIGLNQVILLAAEANGHHNNYSNTVTVEAQRAAFNMAAPRQLQASAASTLSTPTILSNVANKFLMEGWMAVDMTAQRIAAIRSVRDFKQITTVSLTGGMQFEKVGPTGELKHGTVGEQYYNNKADTYGILFGISRADIINDDLGALTAMPRRIGRGGALKLQDIFWAKFLNNSTFFTAARGNFDDGATDTLLDATGLANAETLFMSQTDPDGKPLGTTPAILLVPTALKAKGLALMTSEKIKGDADEPDGNIWRGRFRLESSPYMHNTSYTGASAKKWYLLANPSDMPVIEIVALNGRVEPTVETASADFDVLGIQMRGYSDVGVELQEYRGGVAMKGEA